MSRINNHPKPSVGELVEITSRKCSDKVSPLLQVGMMYSVVSVSKLKDGTQVVEVNHPKKPKHTLRMNANRFDWRVITKKDIAEMAFRKAVEKDTDRLMKEFTQKEQMAICFTPLVIQSLAWIYADKCVEYAVNQRIDILKKLTRTVRHIRKEYEEELSKDLKQDSLDKLENETKRFIKLCGNDFTIMYFTVEREYIRHYPDMEYKELAVNAIIGMLLINFLDDYNKRITTFVQQRLGKDRGAEKMASIDKLYSCLDAYAGYIDKFDFKEKDIVLCMKILYNRLNQIEFDLDGNKDK